MSVSNITYAGKDRVIGSDTNHDEDAKKKSKKKLLHHPADKETREKQPDATRDFGKHPDAQKWRKAHLGFIFLKKE